MRKKMLFLVVALAAVAGSLSSVRVEAAGNHACPICTTNDDGSQCCVSCICNDAGRVVACAQNACAPGI